LYRLLDAPTSREFAKERDRRLTPEINQILQPDYWLDFTNLTEKSIAVAHHSKRTFTNSKDETVDIKIQMERVM